MYQLYFNGYPIHDPRSNTMRIREPDVHLAVGEAGTVSFVLDSSHPNADRITRLKGVLELKADGVRIYKGRVTRDTRDFYLDREIATEGLLACLNDSVIPPHAFPDDFLTDEGYIAAAENGNVVEFYLSWLLAQHNSQVTGAAQQILLGDVTVTDPNNYISRESGDYMTTMEAVHKKLVDLMGGYLLPDYSGDTTVLHYYADLPLTNVQDVEFGKNLLDLVTELDSADTYTAILPTGKDGLTIEALPDGQISPGIVKAGRIIYSQEAEETVGGRIIRQVKWDDVTLDTNLQTKAVTQLTTDGVKTVQTIQAKAVDLGGTGEKFRVGRYIRLKSPPHGFSEYYPLMELDPDILDPGNTQITMGATVKTSSDINHDNQNATDEKLDQTIIDLNKQEGKLEELKEVTRTQITEAIQNSESIIFSALESYVETSDLETFKQEISSELAILADRISLNFEQTTEQITNVDGDLQKIVETLEKHFDFTIDGLTIRAGENAMSLRLDNDLIIFEKNGQQFGWWNGVDFYTGNIVINVNERAQFGAFAFVPRSNGSLSFLKVGAPVIFAITTQPQGGTVSAGGKFSTSVVASGSGLRYQWQQSSDAGNTWSNWGTAGAGLTNTLSFTTSGTAKGTTLYYRCIVTNSDGRTLTTNVVMVKVI